MSNDFDDAVKTAAQDIANHVYSYSEKCDSITKSLRPIYDAHRDTIKKRQQEIERLKEGQRYLIDKLRSGEYGSTCSKRRAKEIGCSLCLQMHIKLDEFEVALAKKSCDYCKKERASRECYECGGYFCLNCLRLDKGGNDGFCLLCMKNQPGNEDAE